MSWSNKVPDGFFLNVRWHFDGNIPDKMWQSFRKKFIKEHASGWSCSKLYDKYGKSVRVDLRCTDVTAVGANTLDTLDFLHTTLSLIVVKEV